MTDKIIKETNIYKLVVGESVLADNDGLVCYKIINKEHGVVETETTVLPQALDWLDEFTRMIENPDTHDVFDDITLAEATQSTKSIN